MGWMVSGPPNSLLDKNGQVITAPQKLAEEQMNYFFNKNSKLLDNIQVNPDIDPLETLDKVFDKWEQEGGSAQRLDIKEVTAATTARLIGKLGDSSAMGFNGLDINLFT